MINAMQRVAGLPRLSLLAMSLLAAVHAHAQDADTPTKPVVQARAQDAQTSTKSKPKVKDLAPVLVVSQRASRVSTGATNLDLDIKDTPQSISVVTKEQMQQFGADSVNDALSLATGIDVEQTSTNNTQFLSRGFEIKNTQIDGIGLPNGWGIVTNAMDSFGFEKIEVIGGANGLLTGVGNASGTINYVRKRPTNTEQGQIGVTYGSENRRRVQADYSTPFNKDGTWAGRVVFAREDSDSYLRDFKSDRTYLYGVVDGQVGENGTLTLGYSWQKANTSGNMWGALTYSPIDGEGSQLAWPRNASTTQDWTYWNTTTGAGFVDYTYQLGDDWQLKASYNNRVYDNNSQLFMAYSLTGLNPVTGQGLLGWAYKSPYKSTANLGDVTLDGQFQLFGRSQEVMFGVSSAMSEETDWYHPTDFGGPAFGALPGFPYAGNAIPEPTWGARTVYTTLNQRLNRVFGVTRVSMTDQFKAILGVNWAQYHVDGNDNTGAHTDQTVHNLSPYVGLTFDFTDNVLGYINYSYIFQPQEQLDYNRNYIASSKGTNSEVGIKAQWLDKRLLTTLAWFNAKQKGLATYGGTRFLDGFAFGYYNGVDVQSKGFEFEATGKLNQYTDLQFGYTQLKMDGDEGSHTYSWVPRRTSKLMLSTHVPSYTALSFGLGGRYQSDIANTDGYTGYPLHQGGYTLFNAFAAWDIRPDLTLRVNAGNLTDKKYILSLYAVSYYGPPSEYSLSVNWRF